MTQEEKSSGADRRVLVGTNVECDNMGGEKKTKDWEMSQR